jgi:hypothetical protein
MLWIKAIGRRNHQHIYIWSSLLLRGLVLVVGTPFNSFGDIVSVGLGGDILCFGVKSATSREPNVYFKSWVQFNR